MYYSETNDVEFKRELSTTYLKTVSAFANYSGGTIVFGVADDGTIIGLADPAQTRLDIENQINDNIRPIPIFRLETDIETNTVSLIVDDSPHKPYEYQRTAYKRADTATVAVDQTEYRRLIMSGLNMTFDSLPSRDQNLSFSYLEAQLKDELKIERLSRDILKTLNLFSDREGFNRAAEMLADRNSYPGIDIARLGESVDIFLDRQRIEGVSILEQLDRTLAYLEQVYTYEQIIQNRRQTVEAIPQKAIREALANAIVHREWDNSAYIRIASFSDRLEITSPGGLPARISAEDYLHGNISYLRNPTIGGVFYRLRIIEQFGTGILRIHEAYSANMVKPSFRIFPNTITVVLPKLQTHARLSEEEVPVYQALGTNSSLSRAELEHALGLGKAKLIRILNSLIDQNIIERIGSGPSVRYRRK